MTKVGDHLGGHLNRTWTDKGGLRYLKKKLKAKTFLDVGCGPGGQIEVANSLGLKTFGIDGDSSLNFPKDVNVQIHDFTLGPVDKDNIQFLPEKGYFDIGWSVEFLEHVDREYIPNFMSAMQLCKVMVVTHATPGQGGHHHVNEQHFPYWNKVFENYGFKVSGLLTSGLRKRSTMKSGFKEFKYEFRGDEVITKKVKTSFMKKNGWVFVNQGIK